MPVRAEPLSVAIRAAVASNGAPGTVVQTEFGPKNPLHIMLHAAAEIAAQEYDLAVPRSRWVLPPTRPGTPGPPTPVPLAAPTPLLPPPLLRARARAAATQVGWSGSAALALPLGLYQGLVRTLTTSPRRLTAPEALNAALAATAPAVYGFVPGPISAAAVARALQSAWDADPFLASGDRSRRVPTASLIAGIIVDVWSMVAPVAAKAGPVPAPPAPPVLAPARML